MKKTKQKIRFIFRGSIAIASYGLSIFYLFNSHELILALISVFIFYISFHFFYLDLYKTAWKYIIIALLIGTIITAIISTPQNLAMTIANIGFHGMILILTYTLYQQADGSIKFSGLAYFLNGGYLFTIALALVYSTIIVNFFSEFPMNCQTLNEQTNKIVTTITSPFKISREKTQEISNSSKAFFYSTFTDISLGAKSIEISSPNESNKIVSTIKKRKETLITKTLEENEKLNNTICDFTLKTINKKLQSPTIQYPVIILILFLIYPFLRLIVFIISFIALLLFEIQYLFKIYNKHKENKEVERIE